MISEGVSLGGRREGKWRVGGPAWRHLGRSEGQASGCKMAFFPKMILEFHCSMRTESQTLLFLWARKRLGRWKGGRKERERASACQSEHQSAAAGLIISFSSSVESSASPRHSHPRGSGQGSLWPGGLQLTALSLQASSTSCSSTWWTGTTSTLSTSRPSWRRGSTLQLCTRPWPLPSCASFGFSSSLSCDWVRALLP